MLSGEKKFLSLLFLALAGCLAGGCATVHVGPEYVDFKEVTEKPVVRLDKINETLTGTWAAHPLAEGFRSSLMKALQEPAAKIFSNEPANLAIILSGVLFRVTVNNRRRISFWSSTVPHNQRLFRKAST